MPSSNDEDPVYRALNELFDEVPCTLLNMSSALGIDLQPPSIIYHYADIRALRGMIEKNEIWMSPVGYLNDTREHRHGCEVFDKHIETCQDQDSSDEQWVRIVEGIKALLSTSQRNEVFATCFATNEDQLSQWRGYGDDGYGYAIGFDTATFEIMLRRMIPKECSFRRPTKVVYEEPDQQKICDYLFGEWKNRMYDAIAKKNLTPPDDFTAKAIAYRFVCRDLLPFFKPSGFREEAEARIVVNTEHVPDTRRKMTFTERRGILVPHLVLRGDHQKIPICHIKIGPNVDADQAEWSLRHLLDDYDFPENIKIDKSGLSYISTR